MADRKPTDKQLYKLKNDYMATVATKVTPYEFFRDLFPVGTLEVKGDRSMRRPNAIFTKSYVSDEGNHYARNTIMFDDLAELDEVIGAEFAVCSPIAYSGRNRTADNARQLFGFCIDLDGVEMRQLEDLIFQIQNNVLPEPTYLVNSGHGFHVYYLFEDPIPLYRHLHHPLNRLKEGLTNIVWNFYTSAIPTAQRQFQGIFQGFRMPGTQSKLGKRYPVVAFRYGSKRTIRSLNDYVFPEYQLKEWDDYRLTLEEAKKKYPKWYQNRIVEGNSTRRKWDIAGKVNGDNPYALYDWWLRRIQLETFEGNRYHCISVLMTYAVKCDIDEEKVLSDALALVPRFDNLTRHDDNHFTEKDVYDALTYCSDTYATYSIRAIESRTKIQIPRNKRNGRKRDVHLRMARSNRDILCEGRGKKDWREGSGRPVGSGTAKSKVQQYRSSHPNARKADCIRETGLSKKTVYKWWNEK